MFQEDAGWETTVLIDYALFEPIAYEGRSIRRVN